MLESKAVDGLAQSMKRIFALKVNRSTWREIQNIAINLSQGDQKTAGGLLESFFTGEIKDEVAKGDTKKHLQKVVDDYGLFVRLAKEINEKGDFVSIISSDTLANQDRFAFLNRVRRVDGEEFHFITDPESTLHMVVHFLNRLHELHKQAQGKETLVTHQSTLEAIQKQIDRLVAEVASAKV